MIYMKKFDLSACDKKSAIEGNEELQILWFKSEFSEFCNSGRLPDSYDAILDALGLILLFKPSYAQVERIFLPLITPLLETYRYADKKVWKRALVTWYVTQAERGRASGTKEKADELNEFIRDFSHIASLTEARYERLFRKKTFAPKFIIKLCIECATELKLHDTVENKKGYHVCRRCNLALVEMGVYS